MLKSVIPQAQWEQRQLASVIISSIPSAMFILISASLPNMIAADGLGILLAICKPHYGATAIKAQIWHPKIA